MQFQIVSHTPGYLRIRFGKYVFTKEQGYGLSSLLLSVSGVQTAVTNSTNGGVKITYTGEIGKTLLTMLRDLRQCDLVEAKPNREQLQKELDATFRKKLTIMVSRKLAFDFVLPTTLHKIYTFRRALTFMRLGIHALRRGRLSVEVLDGTAIGASLFSGSHDTASSIIFLLGLSDLLLEYSNARAKNELASSLTLQISRVWLVRDGVEIMVPIEDLQVDDVIRVRAGSMIPVDGTIVDGEALINESTMTGEPLAAHKNAGSTVFAGTVLETGELDIAVRALSCDSRISKIIQMIDSGEQTKAQIQGKAERLADGIVPVSFGLFLATLGLTGSLSRALSVLMVDFSCAIKLTTPISIISALREAANQQMVVKGGKYLEILSKVDTIVFDKTGTLTNAVPKVSKVIALHEDYAKEQVLTIAACLEEHFPHSVAAAIVAEAENCGLFHPEEHEKVEYIVAHGIASGYQGHRAVIGSYHFVFDDEGVPFPADRQEEIARQVGSDSAVYLAIDNELIGVLCVNDPPRADAKSTIWGLRALGISELLMITGDGEATARHISTQLGLDRYFASVLPDEKATLVQQLKDAGKTVLMVGDGINDAPALSCADVSMTLNGASDIAREVSDITILSEDLYAILTARQLSTTLMRKISQNYRFIVGFNACLIACGIVGWLPASTSAWLHNTSTVGLAGWSARPVLHKQNMLALPASTTEE